MKIFKLTLHLGNDAMQSSDDIAQVLKGLARSLETGNQGLELGWLPLRDANGNNVGSWEVD